MLDFATNHSLQHYVICKINMKYLVSSCTFHSSEAKASPCTVPAWLDKTVSIHHAPGGRLEFPSHHFISLCLLDFFLVPKCGPAWVDPLLGLLKLSSTGPSEGTIFMQGGFEFTALLREWANTILVHTTSSHSSVTNEAEICIMCNGWLLI